VTEADVRRIVAEMFGCDPKGNEIRAIHYQGNVSMKMIGEGVRDVGMQARFVVVDLSGVRSIGGRRPWWRP
jgi:hypothetical protein